MSVLRQTMQRCIYSVLETAEQILRAKSSQHHLINAFTKLAIDVLLGIDAEQHTELNMQLHAPPLDWNLHIPRGADSGSNMAAAAERGDRKTSVKKMMMKLGPVQLKIRFMSVRTRRRVR
ncbi:uncharacterized protein V6R79_016720 [Siganus canaliculatus]